MGTELAVAERVASGPGRLLGVAVPAWPAAASDKKEVNSQEAPRLASAGGVRQGRGYGRGVATVRTAWSLCGGVAQTFARPGAEVHQA